MKFFKIAAIIIFISCLTSCAQKQLPLPNSMNEGLLIIPCVGNNTVSYEFIYRYRFDFNDKEFVSIKMKNKKFFVAKKLKAGKYKIDAIKTYGVNTRRSKAINKNMYETKFKQPYEIEIIPGKISIFPFGVGAELIPRVGGFSQKSAHFQITEEIKAEYIEMIKQAANADKWDLD